MNAGRLIVNYGYRLGDTVNRIVDWKQGMWSDRDWEFIVSIQGKSVSVQDYFTLRGQIIKY
jgi:hypothetical protein